jgi:hypothetical protein
VPRWYFLLLHRPTGAFLFIMADSRAVGVDSLMIIGKSGGGSFTASSVEGVPDAGEAVGSFLEKGKSLLALALGDSEGAACFPYGCLPWSSLPHSGDALGFFEVALRGAGIACPGSCDRGCDVEADGAGLAGPGFRDGPLGLVEGCQALIAVLRGEDQRGMGTNEQVGRERSGLGEADRSGQAPGSLPTAATSGVRFGGSDVG